MLGLWRDTLGARADAALAELAQALDDQDAFARAARKLLAALELAEAEADTEPEEITRMAAKRASNPARRTIPQLRGPATDAGIRRLGAQPEEMQGEGAEQDPPDDAEEDTSGAEGDDRPGGPQSRRERPLVDAEAAIAPIRALSMRRSPPRISATRKSSGASGTSSISSFSTCKV